MKSSNHRTHKRRGYVCAVLALVGAASTGVFADEPIRPRLPVGFDGDTTADAVLGQIDFSHSARNLVDGYGLNTSLDGDVAIDRSVTPNRVYVADISNHRVLGWADVAAFTTHAAADIVIGQPDFYSNIANNGGLSAKSLYSPIGLAVDAKGNLYVVDYNNHRVLEYNTPFSKGVAAGIAADDVFGQFGNFTTSYCNYAGVNADTLCGPWRATVDTAGNLYVSEYNNHRVLKFNTPEAITSVAGSGDTTADLVLGQPDFITNTCNLNGVSAQTLCNAGGLAFDGGGNLLVADSSNHRVLKYSKPLASGASASKVYGQSGFTQNGCNSSGVNENSLCYPTDVAVNGAGEVWIADYNNHRVLGFVGGGGRVPLGQFNSRTSNVCNNNGGGTFPPVNFRSLCNPSGLDFDKNNNLYVVDSNNNRALAFTAPIVVKSGASGVVGQSLLTTGDENASDGFGFNTQDWTGTVAIDRSVTPNRVYVADGANHRVLGWNDMAAFVTHAPATLVFGQPTPYDKVCNNGGVVSATTLCNPYGLAVDGKGNLYVADHGNHRVLEYDTPFAKGTGADKVFGQGGDFTTNFCNKDGLNAHSLCYPIGVAVDGTGNLYVVDYNNHRMLKYGTPLTTDTKADKVFGQKNNFTTNGANLGTGTPSANGMYYPHGVAVDAAGNIYVGDHYNHRVLVFAAPNTDTTADKVFGQSNSMAKNACNPNGVDADSLCYPTFVAVDGSKNVYVTDYGNNRALKYSAPLTTDRTADRVFGQGNLMTRNGCHPAAPNTLCEPNGIAVDADNNLYVSDAEYNRVLKFNKP